MAELVAPAWTVVALLTVYVLSSVVFQITMFVRDRLDEQRIAARDKRASDWYDTERDALLKERDAYLAECQSWRREMAKFSKKIDELKP